jgi:starvation-inducible DNA-binding protein
MSIDIGISAAHRKKIAQGLSRLLADSYTLYLKTHNYHWNVTGPQFNTLHTMFEQQYTELAMAVDEIAERIRALDHPAPGSYKAFAKLTSVEEEQGDADRRGDDPPARDRPGNGRQDGAQGVSRSPMPRTTSRPRIC